MESSATQIFFLHAGLGYVLVIGRLSVKVLFSSSCARLCSVSQERSATRQRVFHDGLSSTLSALPPVAPKTSRLSVRRNGFVAKHIQMSVYLFVCLCLTLRSSVRIFIFLQHGSMPLAMFVMRIMSAPKRIDVVRCRTDTTALKTLTTVLPPTDESSSEICSEAIPSRKIRLFLGWPHCCSLAGHVCTTFYVRCSVLGFCPCLCIDALRFFLNIRTLEKSGARQKNHRPRSSVVL